MKDKYRFEVKNPTQPILVEKRSPEGYQWPTGQCSQRTADFPWPLPFFFFLSHGYWKEQDTGLTGRVANQIQLFFCLQMLQWCQGPQSGTSLWARRYRGAPPRWALSSSSPSAKGKGWAQRCISCWFCKPGEQIRCVLWLVSASKATPPNKRGSSSAFSCFSACSVQNHLQRKDCTCSSSILSPGMGLLAVEMFSGGFHLFVIPCLWC